MAAVGKWGGRIGYVGNLLGCPYIQCNPPFVHSSNKAWSVPRLLRHSGSGLGGIRGYGGAMPAHGKRQRGAAHCAIMDSCIFFPFQHWSMAGLSWLPCPQCYHFWGARPYGDPCVSSSPLVTRGQVLKKPLNQRLIFFPCLLVISN